MADSVDAVIDTLLGSTSQALQTELGGPVWSIQQVVTEVSGRVCESTHWSGVSSLRPPPARWCSKRLAWKHSTGGSRRTDICLTARCRVLHLRCHAQLVV